MQIITLSKHYKVVFLSTEAKAWLDWVERRRRKRSEGYEYILSLFGNIKWGERKGTDGKISPSSPPPPNSPHFYLPSKWEGNEENILPPSPPSSLITYSNKVNTNHILFLLFPSITFPLFPFLPHLFLNPNNVFCEGYMETMCLRFTSSKQQSPHSNISPACIDCMRFEYR